MDRIAQEREDHILDCYETIKQRDAEIERLRANSESLRNDSLRTENKRLRAEIERLRAALEPFARNVYAVSLREALGHIERKHLEDARRALEDK